MLKSMYANNQTATPGIGCLQADRYNRLGYLGLGLLVVMLLQQPPTHRTEYNPCQATAHSK